MIHDTIQQDAIMNELQKHTAITINIKHIAIIIIVYQPIAYLYEWNKYFHRINSNKDKIHVSFNVFRS